MAGQVTAALDAHAGSNRAQDILMPIAASWIILLASFVNFLRYNDYPLLRPEIGLLAFAMLLLAGGVGLLHRSQSPFGQSMLDMLLVYLIVNQNGGGLFYSAIAAAVAGGVTLYRRRSVLPLLGLSATVALISGLIGIGQQYQVNAERSRQVTSPSTDAHKPPVLVHIILDEHLGVEGFSYLGQRGEALKQELQSFYASRGFRLFGRAYAEQFRTVNSIPQILNFGTVLEPEANPFDGASFDRNRYFDALADRGYRLNVYQSNFLNYCGNRSVSRCVTYDFSGLDAVDRASIPVVDRAAVILARFALLSDVARNLEGLYITAVNRLERKGITLPHFGLITGGRTTPLSAISAFDRFIADVSRAQPGDAFFAHILLPHDPYQLKPDCTVRPLRQWQLHDPSTPIAARQAAYLDQVRCAVRKVDAAYAALSHAMAGQAFIMIVHGDHGSRITNVNPTAESIGDYTKEDLVAGFSTLFAVRAPDVASGYEEQPIAVSQLLKDLTQSRFAAVPQPATASPHVILNDRNWVPGQRIPFPQSW